QGVSVLHFFGKPNHEVDLAAVGHAVNGEDPVFIGHAGGFQRMPTVEDPLIATQPGQGDGVSRSIDHSSSKHGSWRHRYEYGRHAPGDGDRLKDGRAAWRQNLEHVVPLGQTRELKTSIRIRSHTGGIFDRSVGYALNTRWGAGIPFVSE